MSLSASDPIVDAAVVPLDAWTLIGVTGDDRVRFLHAQLSADVRGLELDTACLGTLLDLSGRLQAVMLVVRKADRVLFAVPREAAERTLGRLAASVIADDVEVQREEHGPLRLELGAAAIAAADTAGPWSAKVEAYGSRGVVAWSQTGWTAPVMDRDEAEARRILSGFPLWGEDASPGQLVTETVLAETGVSYTKGCFLGQETVAKVRAGRGAAYLPVLLVPEERIEDPATLRGRSLSSPTRRRAGSVLAVAEWRGRIVVEAAVHRELRVDGRSVELTADDGQCLRARVEGLPCLAGPSAVELAETVFHRAVEAFSADREEDALELLDRALAVDPAFGDAYESLGVIYGRRGEYERAIELMQRLLEVDPDSVMAHTNMSLYHNRLGRIDEAEREAALAAEKSLELARRKREREDSARRAETDRAAELRRREEMFSQVLEIDPDDPLGNFGMGELLVDGGRYDRAVEHLERAIRADPSYSAAYLSLGRAWQGRGEPEAARSVYLQGIEVASKRGDLMTANKMQDRLARLERGAA